jgi:hypothetical protein
MSSNNADTPRTGKVSVRCLQVLDSDDVAATPTEKKPRVSLDSEEKPKKAKASLDSDCPDKKADDLNPLEIELLKAYEMDEVGGSWTSWRKSFEEDKLDSSLTHSVASQVAAAWPASTMYGHGSALETSVASQSPTKSPEWLWESPERVPVAGPPQLRHYDSGTLEMWDPEWADPAAWGITTPQ